MKPTAHDRSKGASPQASQGNGNTCFWSTLIAAVVLTLSQFAQANLGASHTSLVSEFASFNSPGVVDGRVEAIAIEGDTVYVGGTFTQVREPLNGEIFDQPYLFAYSKSSGNIIRDFDPILNNQVLALETIGDGSGVFAGGMFNIINGESNRRGIVKIDNNGDRIAGFSARTNALVKTLVRLNNTLYIGGNFSSIGQTAVENLAAVDTITGSVLPGLNLDFGGVISTNRTTGVQSVDDIDITSDGQLMVVIGNFSTINGYSRSRLALIELDGQARVSDWNTNVYDVQCPATLWPQYVRGIDIAPDDSYFVSGSSGYRIIGNPACDTILRFELDDLNDGDVEPTWTNYTGGDSVFEVVATEHAVYAGGHFRTLNNGFSPDGGRTGPGSVQRRGFAAIDPLNGLTLLNWRADRNPRGVGTFSLIAEDEGLYIGDDTNFLNGTEHPKLKFLPISSDTINRPEAPSLPATILSVNGNALEGRSFDGTSFGNPVELLDSGFENVRGAMFIGGQLFHADVNDNIWVSNFNGNAFEPHTSVDLFGLTDSQWNLDQVGGMFFDYEWSRVYYTIRGDSRLFYRAFTPDSPYFGEREYVAEQQSDVQWNAVSGMDIINGYLYFGLSDGYLYRAQIDGAAVIAGTTEAISGPFIDGRSWNNSFLSFLGDGMAVNEPDAQYEFKSSGTDTIRRFQTFEFPVSAGEPVVLRLAWDDPGAKLNIFLRDANDELVVSDNTAAGSPKWLTAPAGSGGIYIAAVVIQEGSTNYTLKINPDEEPPAPLADFEFASSGTDTAGRFQTFNFDVVAGELVEAQIIWDDPNADVRVFLRDENRKQMDRDIQGNGSSTLSAIAETSGQWSVAVLINSGSINYDILVDTTTDFVLPEPLADFEFNSSGDDVNGRFQTFNFDVVAGELVEAQVIWDDPNTDIRIFLRDENRNQMDRNTDGIGTGTVSTIAQTSGRWSVAVLIRSGAANYDVLVDTTSNGAQP